MRKTAKDLRNTLAGRLCAARYRLTAKAERLRRAWRYAFSRLSPDDAQHVILECRDSAGWYPLLILSVDETLEEARRNYADHPALPQLITSACARVGAKWEDYGEAIREARSWAIELAEDYARHLNIVLIPWDDILPPDKAKPHADLS
ncbi:hypothetical protein [Methylocapsa aurea]|uniref:hypothetical protein n=1 Tax=Methylocapsa aurea TaxID=663610 RepID=UPI0012ECAEC8|nr:hypothetical protein [Methylocapsa aurea]